MKKIDVKDFELSKVQDNAVEAFNRLKFDFQVLNGTFKQVTIGVLDTVVEHGLQRQVIGYIPVQLDANSVIYTSSTTNLRPKDQIILRASATVVTTLYIF